jgi:hypothetical protein
MLHAQEILVYSALVVTALSFVLLSRIGIAGYRSVLTGRSFVYKFDRSRLPKSICAVALLGAVSFGYGFLIARHIDLALIFCFLATVPGGISLALTMTYIPKKTHY